MQFEVTILRFATAIFVKKQPLLNQSLTQKLHFQLRQITFACNTYTPAITGISRRHYPLIAKITFFDMRT